jgi:HTH-type transcriptional regulator/antitoxin HigA
MITIATEKLVHAWGELQSLVPFRVIRSEQEYDQAIEVLNELLDTVGDDERHPLYELLDTLSTLVHDYEERHYPEPVNIGINVLRFLMEEHRLTPVDLPELGNPEEVQDLLSGNRELSVQDIQILSKRFSVSPATFL